MGTVNLKLEAAPHITEICRQLQAAGYEAYIVGGAVRDFLLHKVPKDYDLSTSATPEDIRGVFGRRQARIIGRRFRLVHLRHGTEIIEVSTFRRTPARHDQEVDTRRRLGDVPENMIFNDNEFGNAVEDAERRDFTVNAIFYDPVACRLVDHTGMGLGDLENRVIRAIGVPDLRFEEDPVRILRALKFAGQCGMSLEAETERALRRNMPLIRLAAPSRLSLELEKILKNTSGHHILRLFNDYGFLDYFLPALARIWDKPEGINAIRLLEERNRRVAEKQYRDSISVAISLLLLPCLESLYGELRPGGSWRGNRSKEEFGDELMMELKRFFAPHSLIKALCYSAERTLALLPELLSPDRHSRIYTHPGYHHAREVLVIVNALRWQDQAFESGLPIPDDNRTSKAGQHQHHHRRRRRPRRRAAGKEVRQG